MGSSFRSSLRTVTRLSVLALLLAAPLTPPAATATSSTGNGEMSTASLHEVRLRKLHLVRPDLIPYPIAYEVVC